jgi:hypothetical protein
LHLSIVINPHIRFTVIQKRDLTVHDRPLT